MTIYFDMDGTIVDFYSVPNWLDMLVNEDVTPYVTAYPLVNLSRLARLLHKAQNRGIKIGIISWGSKGATDEFNARIEQAKRDWLAQHLPSVTWDEIHIAHYGDDKWNLSGQEDDSVLFDDEERNRKGWGSDYAFEPDAIFEILKQVC